MSILKNAAQANREAIRAAERRRAQIPAYHIRQPKKGNGRKMEGVKSCAE